MRKLHSSGKIVTTTNNRFKIVFPFNRETLNIVRSIPGRVYDYTNKFWTCPINQENAILLRVAGFEISGLIEENSPQVLDDPIKKLKPIKIIGFGKKLYPFQNIGVSYLQKQNGRGLIADEMGLGKTIQTAAWLHLHRDKTPVIIICPSAVKLNWKKELISCFKNPKAPKIAILKGKKVRHVSAKIYIINYDILSGWVPFLRSLKPQVVITDECHYYKSNKAKRTKAVKLLCKNVPHFIALSGTPIINRPMEIFNAVKLVNPTLFTNFWEYAKEYCGAKHNGFGWDFNGASNTEQLHKVLVGSGTMIRRKKKEVLADLPDKVYSVIPCEIYNRSTYIQAEDNFIHFLETTKGSMAAERASNAEVLTKIEVLKQVAVEGKLEETISWIQDFLETGEKLVVFAHHKFVIKRLMEEFRTKAVNTIDDRDAAVTAFQNDPYIKLFVGRFKSDGVGITLTAASNIAFIELPWTPGELSQAEDRCHRITQKDSVSVYYFISEDTIEVKIMELLDQKRKVLDGVLDGMETDQSSLLSSLMESYT